MADKRTRLEAIEALVLEAKREGILRPEQVQEYEIILEELKLLKELASK